MIHWHSFLLHVHSVLYTTHYTVHATQGLSYGFNNCQASLPFKKIGLSQLILLQSIVWEQTGNKRQADQVLDQTQNPGLMFNIKLQVHGA